MLWCCGELGIPFRRYDAGGLFGGIREAEYLALNPMGLVPTSSDGGFVLWESNAIVRYLSAEYGSGTLWPDDNKERALADKWIDYGLSTLFPAFRDALVGLNHTPQTSGMRRRSRLRPRTPQGSYPCWTRTSETHSMWLVTPLP